MSGTVAAVAGRTSDGLPAASAEPQSSAAMTPSAIPNVRSTGAPPDWFLVVLGLVAVTAFGRAIWLLLVASKGDDR